MVFQRRARIAGGTAGGLYFLLVSALCVICWTHPTGLGLEWYYPFIATLPWSGFGEIGWGIFLGLLLNTALIFFIAAGLAKGISKGG
jgi:hypothetical protein